MIPGMSKWEGPQAPTLRCELEDNIRLSDFQELFPSIESMKSRLWIIRHG